MTQPGRSLSIALPHHGPMLLLLAAFDTDLCISRIVDHLLFPLSQWTAAGLWAGGREGEEELAFETEAYHMGSSGCLDSTNGNI